MNTKSVCGLKILDCSLRDGAHINGGRFGRTAIKNIIDGLANAKIDIVEIGFLKDCFYDPDVTNFSCLSQAQSLISDLQGPSEYALMVRPDWYDIKQLKPACGKIRHLRFAFHKSDLNLALYQAKCAKEMGYSTYLNPVNTPGYDDEDLRRVLDQAHKVEPDGIFIVDTFGSLNISSLRRIYSLYRESVASKIQIGIHLHENLSMSFAMAQYFISNSDILCDKIIDASLLGIGRVPGNLPVELIAQYVNQEFNPQYNINSLLAVIDHEIAPIKEAHGWGYSPEYFLTAIKNVHRSYAEVLRDEMQLPLVKIADIVEIIAEEKMGDSFDPDYLKYLLIKKGLRNEAIK